MMVLGRKALLLIILTIPGIVFSDAATIDTRPEIKIGFHVDSFPDLTLTDSSHTLEFINEEFGRISKLKISNIYYRDIKKLCDDFRRGMFDLLIIPPLTIVKHFNIELLRDGMVATTDEMPLDTLQLVTRKNKGLDSVGALQGKRISLLGYEELPEFYLGILVSQISKKGISHFFSNIDIQKKSQRLILNLFFNQTDAVLLFRSQILLAIEMNPQIGTEFQVIEQLENIPRGIAFFHKDVSQQLREYFIQQVLEFQDSVRGHQLLEILKADVIKRAYLSDLQAIIYLYSDNKHTK
jgi:hypothetical protein